MLVSNPQHLKDPCTYPCPNDGLYAETLTHICSANLIEEVDENKPCNDDFEWKSPPRDFNSAFRSSKPQNGSESSHLDLYAAHSQDASPSANTTAITANSALARPLQKDGLKHIQFRLTRRQARLLKKFPGISLINFCKNVERNTQTYVKTTKISEKENSGEHCSNISIKGPTENVQEALRLFNAVLKK